LRIRTIKPEFFRDVKLADLDIAHPEAHVMLVFQGLWCVADRAGRFGWEPRVLKLDILPFHDFDMARSLEALVEIKCLQKYEVDGRCYGQIVNWDRHQIPGRDEPMSEIPSPEGYCNQYQRPPNSTQRAKIYSRDGYRCAYCGRDMTSDIRARCLDHVIPYSQQGTNSEENLVTACKPCNAKKSDRDPTLAGMKWPTGYGQRYVNGVATACQQSLNTTSIPSDKEWGREVEVGSGIGKGDEKLPPQTAQLSPEIIPPDQTGILETPDGLHPNQYATRLLEEIKFPVVPHNIRAVAAAIECEGKTMGMVSAYEFVLECTKFAIFEECEINTFFFTDGKYRAERRNGNGRQVSTAASRSQRSINSLANAFGKRAREGDPHNPGKRQSGTG
jgi:5-methylcytosine-specific restriction endonuclease McrA